MTETIIQIILLIVATYLAIGFVFALVFVISGVNKIDEGAHGSSIGFRIIIIPGVIVFWTVLLKKWMRHNKQEKETPQYSFAIKPLRKKHFQVWQLLALFLPLIIIAAVAVRPEFSKSKLLQPTQGVALPVVLKKADNENHSVSIRCNNDTSQMQLEWINKKTFTYPSATIYKTTNGDSNISGGNLIGRIEARGTYYFPLDSTFKPINQSTYQLVVYDFIHQKIIDTIKF